MVPGRAEMLPSVTASRPDSPLGSAPGHNKAPLPGGLGLDQLQLGGDPDSRLRPGQRTLPGTYDSRGNGISLRPEARSQRRAEPRRELSLDEQRVIRQLQARDAEVRAHEAAHKGAGGTLAGAASYSYQQGPDGRNYAIGGEVSIRMPASGDAESMVRNAQQVRRAALAPASPSGADMAIASMATRVEQQARGSIRAAQVEESARAAEARGAGGASAGGEGTSGAALGAVPDGRPLAPVFSQGETFVAKTESEPLPPPRPRPPEPPPEPKAKEPPPPPREPPPLPEE